MHTQREMTGKLVEENRKHKRRRRIQTEIETKRKVRRKGDDEGRGRRVTERKGRGPGVRRFWWVNQRREKDTQDSQRD